MRYNIRIAMPKQLKLLSYFLLMAIAINNASASTVEISSGKLADQLHENEQVDFSIKIKDYGDAKQLSIETNLVPSSDKPLWDFGDSNPIINVNRYQQKVMLNSSSLPAILTVSISGKVPEGVDRIKCNDLVINKLQSTKLKFYEVRTDEKLVRIESFELIIKTKEDFEKTLQGIRRKEFDGMKENVRKVFDMGLTTEAQNIANDMERIIWPDNLKLFGIIKLDNEFLINAIVIGASIIGFVFGYVIGSKEDGEPED